MTTAELEAIRALMDEGEDDEWDAAERLLPACQDAGKRLLAELAREVAHSEALADEIGDLQEALTAMVAGPIPARKPRTFDYTIGGCTLPLPCGGYVTHHIGLVPRTEVHKCRGSKCGEPVEASRD